jgi:SAM-dependent methyltransferase
VTKLSLSPRLPTRPARKPRERRLRIDEAAIRRAARRRGPRSLPSICWNYAITAAKIRWRNVFFRQNRNHLACQAYRQMNLEEFQALNARQAWANWRTIPRNLAGRLPQRPVLALDLCCGVGESTEVLAYYCAPGSAIIGLEFNPTFVQAARQGACLHASGRAADVTFLVQNVLETFRGENGAPLANGTVDLINASGAIGCHFDAAATAVVAQECARVLKPGGLALIDAGREGTGSQELTALFSRHGFRTVHRARSCVFDRFWQLCLQKAD